MRTLRPFLSLLALLSLPACAESVAGGGSTPGADTPPENRCGTSCNAVWSQDLGGANWSAVATVGTDAWGNVVVAGNVSGGTNTLGVPASADKQQFVAKLDPAGHLLWEKTLPDAAGAPVVKVRADGTIFLIGAVASSGVLDLGAGAPLGPVAPGTALLYVVELDGDGHPVESHGIPATTGPNPSGNDYVELADAALDPNGGLVLAGNFSGPLDFGDGALGYPQNALAGDVFVLSLDASWKRRFSMRFGSQPDGNTTVSDTDMDLHGIGVQPDSSIVLGIELFGAVHVGGNVITSAGVDDVLVAGLDPSGGVRFTRRFGGPGSDSLVALTTGWDGTILFTGFATGPVDFGNGPLPDDGSGQDQPFVAALAPDGALRWSVRGETFDGGYGTGVAQAPDGGVIATFGDGGRGSRIAVHELDPETGTTLHARSFALTEDPTNFDAALALGGLALDPLGNAVLGGGFRGVVAFDGPALTMNDQLVWGQAAFLAKVAP